VTELKLSCCGTVSTEDSATLGSLISGVLSSLEFLSLSYTFLDIVALMDSIKIIPEVSSSNLRELNLWNTRMTDKGVSAFVSAVEDGAFRKLSRLTISENRGITDKGAIVLATSIRKGHFKDIQRLSFEWTNIRLKGVIGLVSAVLLHCPKLRFLTIPCIGPDLDSHCGHSSRYGCTALPSQFV
jgi:hypothetical protein